MRHLVFAKMYYYNILYFFVLFSFSSGDYVPSFQKCHIEDANCLKTSAQEVLPMFINGIPEYNVASLDPYKVDLFNISTPDLKFLISNAAAIGAKSFKVLKMQIKNSKLTLQVLCDLLEVEGDYEIDGKILFLPIQGRGKTHLILRKMIVSAEADMVEFNGKDGKKHWKIKSFTNSFELKDKASIEMDNLFNGNEALGKAVADLFANSSNEVVYAVIPPLITQLAGIVIKNINNFFKHLAIEDITLPSN